MQPVGDQIDYPLGQWDEWGTRGQIKFVLIWSPVKNLHWRRQSNLKKKSCALPLLFGVDNFFCTIALQGWRPSLLMHKVEITKPWSCHVALLSETEALWRKDRSSFFQLEAEAPLFPLSLCIRAGASRSRSCGACVWATGEGSISLTCGMSDTLGPGCVISNLWVMSVGLHHCNASGTKIVQWFCVDLSRISGEYPPNLSALFWCPARVV